MEAVESFCKQLDGPETDVLRELVKVFVERLMAEQADAICGAPYGERSEERVNKRNGYRSRAVDTRVGTIEVGIPKLREGSYFPTWLVEPRRRAERALVAVVAECYVKCVSTLNGSTIRITLPAILVDQPAEHVPSFDRRSDPPDLRCSVAGGYSQAQPPVSSLLHVVIDVRLEHSLEMSTTVDQDVVEALPAHGPHEPL